MPKLILLHSGGIISSVYLKLKFLNVDAKCCRHDYLNVNMYMYNTYSVDIPLFFEDEYCYFQSDFLMNVKRNI